MPSQRHPALTSVALGVGAVAVTAALAVGAGTLVRAYVPDDEDEPTEPSEPPEATLEPPRAMPLDASEVATADASVAVVVNDDVPIAQPTRQPAVAPPRPPPRRRARVRTRAS